MKIVEHARQGLQNLYHAKLRSILALLGVLVGTASVVAMVLGGELATNEALQQFKSLGTDLLAVSLNNRMDEDKTSAGKIDKLNLTQSLDLLRADPAILVLAPYTQLYFPIYFSGHPLSATILGVTDSFEEVAKIHLQSGRFISIADHYAFYCVIGQAVYNQIKLITQHDPIGEQLQIGKNIFVIVGVAQAWPENSFVYANIDNAILIPLLTSQVVSQYANINNILLRLQQNADITRVQNNLSNKINLAVSNKQITFRSARELIAKMHKQSEILTVFLALIGSISLLVGGIGVMNIMLVSVMERKREIGVRLAVGARRRDVGILFLLEAIMLALLGGSLGVLIGILIAYLLSVFWHWTFTFFIWPPLAGFSVSVAVGIFFGSYPAYVATKLDPIAALRAE